MHHTSASDGQTDRQTDGRRDVLTAPSVLFAEFWSSRQRRACGYNIFSSVARRREFRI